MILAMILLVVLGIIGFFLFVRALWSKPSRLGGPPLNRTPRDGRR